MDLKPDWSYNKLNQLGFVGRGKSRHRPRNAPFLYGGKYPFIQTAEIKAADLHVYEYNQTYNEDGLAQSKLWEPGTLCVTIAANIAETAILGIRGCFPDSVVGFVADTEKADAYFVKYFIDTIKLRMQNVSKGTTQDNLSLDKLLRFDILTPPLPTQQTIATILSTYDKLIENNNRRILILEEMARLIYQGWFGNYHFPNYDKVKMVDSSFGKIPDGWEAKQLGDLCRKRSDKLIEADHSHLPLLDLAKMLQHTLSVKETGNPQELSSSRILFNEDDILFGSIRPYLHKVNIAPCKGVTNVSVFVIRPNNYILNAFLSIFLSSHDVIQWADKHSTGTKMPVLKWEVFQNMPVLVPDESILVRFQEIISPMLQIIKTSYYLNMNLRLTRNILLPKLISGEVDVSELDIDTAEAAS